MSCKAGILYPSILLSLDILSQDSDGANYLGYVIPILQTILDMRYCHATILSIFRSLGSVVVVCTFIKVEGPKTKVYLCTSFVGQSGPFKYASLVIEVRPID